MNNRHAFEWEVTDKYLLIRTFAGRTLPAMPGFAGGWSIAQGSTAELAIALVNGDRDDAAWKLATGWTCTAKARVNYGDTATLFTATATLSDHLPNIILGLTAATTTALDFTGGVLDVELVNGSTVLKILSCPVSLLREAV